MIAYLNARIHERWTWIALAVFIASILVFWYYRGQIYTHIVATLALFKAATKDGIERRMLEWFKSLFTKPAVSGIPQETPMSIGSYFQLITDAPDFFKLIQDGAAVEADLKTNGLAALSNPTTQTFLSDVVKVFSDIKGAGIIPADPVSIPVSVPTNQEQPS